MKNLLPILSILSMTACNFSVSQPAETIDSTVVIVDTTDTIAVDTLAVDSAK